MTDGRVFTPEDELDVLHEDLGKARRRVASLEQAELDHRVTDHEEHELTLFRARENLRELERELAVVLEVQAQAEDAYREDVA